MKPLAIVLVMASCLFSGVALAQNTNEVVESELRAFPWFDDQAPSSFKRVGESPAESAKTLNRGSLPPQAKSNWNWPQFPNWDFSWMNTLMWIGIGIGIAAIVFLLAWFFFKMESTSVKSRSTDGSNEELLQQRIKQLPFEFEENGRGDFRAMAGKAARSGDYGRATMLLFSHVLISLDQKGLIKLKKGKTNRQYLSELFPHRSLILYFEKIMIPFEDHFFGDHSIEAGRFNNCWKELDSFLNDVDKISQGAVL